MQFIFITIIFILPGTNTAFGQSTICLGVNCPDALSDSQNPFLGDDELFADQLHDKTVELAKRLGTYDDDQVECYTNCRKERRSGLRSCDLSTRLNDWTMSRDDVAYAICKKYQEDRYRECLDPFEKCDA